MIINNSTKSIYLIESKRFCQNDIKVKRRRLGQDAERLICIDYKTRFKDFFRNGESLNDYSVYGVLLFDLWTYIKNHKSESEAFELWKSFCTDYDVEKLSDFFSLDSDTTYKIAKVKENFIATIQDVIRYEESEMKSEYHLGAFVFKINTNTE